ncbi:ComEC family competence protein [Maribacter algarum]|uniref:ComEC family competence protein n=1 Tax=Maribacter algarum (ex Zhang et al. 2020) TaxID=2578118 RepID=A0A5S3PX90_9FLAO|nr:ComEC/Rec2 family competence protein [Maribacter algarum]TMM59480.1 ComEC family competence protein [Maribacter algarum]
MALLKFVPIKLTLCLVTGILIGHYFDFAIYHVLFSTLILIAFLGFLLSKQTNRNSISFGLTTLLTTIFLGILSVSLWQPKNQKDHYTHQNLEETYLWKVKVREVLKSNLYSDRYMGNIFSMDEKKVSGKLVMNLYRDSGTVKFQVDDELFIFRKLSEIKPPLNPHQFDYQSYLANMGIYHQIQLDSTNHFVNENSSKTIYGIAASVRNKIISKLQKANFGKEELSIIQALLLGQRDDLSKETYNNYKNAGAVHILAVSGLHIGILLLLLQFLLRPLERLPKGKTIKLIVLVLLLWCFALLAGFSASIVRAVTMFSFVAYALYLNRPSNTFNILALSMFAILLLINPMLLFQVGFQMSYAAVLAIVWIYPMLQQLWSPKNKIIRKIWQLLSVSVAAQLGVLPISLFYFHQFPGLFFISNLIIVPAMGLILGMGILIVMLALFDMLPQWLAEFYNGVIGLMNSIIEWVAQQEAFVFKDISFDTMQLLLSYGIIISLLMLFTRINFKRLALFLVCIMSFQLWTIYTSYKTRNTQILLLAHRSKNSVLLYQSGYQLNVTTSDSISASAIVKDYEVAKRIQDILFPDLQNGYTWRNKTILMIDSLGIYPSGNHDYILLTQSPKINLERLIDSVQPKQIIADGSNYRSYIARWRKTCAKRKLPFHYTGEKGAYYFE